MIKRSDFFESQTIASAYVAKRAKDFNFLVAGQAEELYVAAGMVFPVSVSSTLDYISRKAPVSQSEVSRALDQPHQLVAYRIKELEKLKLVRRKPDPSDGRRTLLHLTSKGRKQSEKLQIFSEQAASVFNELFEEIDVNLSEAIGKAISALKAHSLEERFLEVHALQEKQR